ncbi:flagellar protein FlgJ [Rhodoferax ferrireducens]|uniref:Flagellar protein FlgJ n=1 Tax=Rhodoferax ferrireducens TaxID=192843 RepID=A0ABU2CE00_9BURK|nr:glucosaminidase domain-containing protein [Rhodoferax ferrireducens]MDR7379572.1 flagellar protein FlgJ [Rhodoferax ferrireducens]
MSLSLNPLNQASQVSSNALAADVKSLNALKQQAGQDSPAAIKETAKQLESLFMRELIKSMREATTKSGMFDSPQGDLGTDLLDQQLSVTMSGRPGGLSEAIERQLTRQTVPADGSTLQLGTPASRLSPAPVTGPVSRTTSQSDFVQRHNGTAMQVEKDTGLPASYLLGQAGHETGWGRKEILNKDGSTSFNLFGIKAGSSWTGKTTTITTTEVINGESRKVSAKFRAYDSYEESFKDYAKLINESPRYAQARQQTGSSQAYATELKRAGYATDPDYAAKLTRAISTTQQLRRAYA